MWELCDEICWSKDVNGEFCFGCNCNKEEKGNFEDWMGKFRSTLKCYFDFIPLNNIIYCALHAKLRITNKLMKLLATIAYKQGVLEFFGETVREIGIHDFEANYDEGTHNRKAKGVIISSLSGKKCDKVIDNLETIVQILFSDICVGTTISDEKQDTLMELFYHWRSICKIIQDPKMIDSEIIDTIDETLIKFGKAWTEIFTVDHVIPYIHVVICHTKKFLQEHGSIGMFSQEGFEGAHKLQKRIYYFSTSHDGQVSQSKFKVSSIQQILLKFFRMYFLQWGALVDEWRKIILK